ncbi:MAG: hypothetical protein WCB99_12040 [Candidatus Cybelea sp.]
MHRSVIGLSLLSVATVFWSGCASLGSSPAPINANLAQAPSSDGVVLMRGRSLPAPAQRKTRPGWLAPEAKSGRNLLYVADQSAGAIEIYKQKGSNQQPIGEITQSVSEPDGLFVDSRHKLYVCNFGNGTVTVYPAGSKSPSETLTGAGSPIDVVVAKNGTVYVANFNSGTAGTVLEYPKGQTAPSKTLVTFGTASFPEGLAIDSAKNLYVAFNTNDGEVLEFGPGSPSGKNLGIHVGYVGGLTIDRNNDLLLDDQNLPGVDVFPPGSHTPSEQIKGFKLAFDVALNHTNTKLWITDTFSPPSVNEVSYPSGTIVDTINSLESAFGVATSPDGSE